MNGIGLKNLERALSRYIEVGVDSGTASGGSNTTLDDTSKDWEVDRWIPGDIHIFKEGIEYVRTLVSNTVTQLTLAPLPPGVVVEAGDAYSIRMLTIPKIMPTTVTKYAVAMPAADTEYSQALPAWTKGFRIHLRDFSEFRLAYETGRVAAPVDPYETVPANAEKYEDNLVFASLTLYFASPDATKTAEIEAWS